MDQRRDPGDLDHFMDQVEELESKVDIMQASIRKTKEQYQKKANASAASLQRNSISGNDLDSTPVNLKPTSENQMPLAQEMRTKDNAELATPETTDSSTECSSDECYTDEEDVIDPAANLTNISDKKMMSPKQPVIDNNKQGIPLKQTISVINQDVEQYNSDSGSDDSSTESRSSDEEGSLSREYSSCEEKVIKVTSPELATKNDQNEISIPTEQNIALQLDSSADDSEASESTYSSGLAGSYDEEYIANGSEDSESSYSSDQTVVHNEKYIVNCGEENLIQVDVKSELASTNSDHKLASEFSKRVDLATKNKANEIEVVHESELGSSNFNHKLASIVKEVGIIDLATTNTVDEIAKISETFSDANKKNDFDLGTTQQDQVQPDVSHPERAPVLEARLNQIQKFRNFLDELKNEINALRPEHHYEMPKNLEPQLIRTKVIDDWEEDNDFWDDDQNIENNIENKLDTEAIHAVDDPGKDQINCTGPLTSLLPQRNLSNNKTHARNYTQTTVSNVNSKQSPASLTVHIPIDTTDEESESDNGQETDKSSVIDEPNTVEKVVNRIPEMNWLFMEAKSFKTAKDAAKYINEIEGSVTISESNMPELHDNVSKSSSQTTDPAPKSALVHFNESPTSESNVDMGEDESDQEWGTENRSASRGGRGRGRGRARGRGRGCGRGRGYNRGRGRDREESPQRIQTAECIHESCIICNPSISQSSSYSDNRNCSPERSNSANTRNSCSQTGNERANRTGQSQSRNQFSKSQNNSNRNRSKSRNGNNQSSGQSNRSNQSNRSPTNSHKPPARANRSPTNQSPVRSNRSPPVRSRKSPDRSRRSRDRSRRSPGRSRRSPDRSRRSPDRSRRSPVRSRRTPIFESRSIVLTNQPSNQCDQERSPDTKVYSNKRADNIPITNSTMPKSKCRKSILSIPVTVVTSNTLAEDSENGASQSIPETAISIRYVTPFPEHFEVNNEGNIVLTFRDDMVIQLTRDFGILMTCLSRGISIGASANNSHLGLIHSQGRFYQQEEEIQAQVAFKDDLQRFGTITPDDRIFLTNNHSNVILELTDDGPKIISSGRYFLLTDDIPHLIFTSEGRFGPEHAETCGKIYKEAKVQNLVSNDILTLGPLKITQMPNGSLSLYKEDQSLRLQISPITGACRINTPKYRIKADPRPHLVNFFFQQDHNRIISQKGQFIMRKGEMSCGFDGWNRYKQQFRLVRNEPRWDEKQTD